MQIAPEYAECAPLLSYQPLKTCVFMIGSVNQCRTASLSCRTEAHVLMQELLQLRRTQQTLLSRGACYANSMHWVCCRPLRTGSVAISVSSCDCRAPHACLASAGCITFVFRGYLLQGRHANSGHIEYKSQL